MRLLQYKVLDLKRVKPAFAEVGAAIEAGDFKSPDVKRLHVSGHYRAKLDDSNRLQLKFARHGSATMCLAREVIANHAYEKSRFLRGAPVDEARIEHEPHIEPAQCEAEGRVLFITQRACLAQSARAMPAETASAASAGR